LKALVLLHGWAMNPAVFSTLSERLSQRFEVHTPPMPGYFGSAKCEPYTLERLVEAIAATSPKRCSVVGWSLGGQVALAWAQARPQQLDRVALIATTPCFVERNDWRAALAAQVFDTFAADLNVSGAATIKRFITLQAKGDSKARHVSRTLRGALDSAGVISTQVLRESLDVLRTTDLRSDLASIPHDALVMHGECDTLVPTAAAEYLAENLPRAEFALLRGAAHAPFVSCADEVAQLTEAFLS